MQFDNVIQVGVWTGSAEQIECVRQAACDVNFDGYDSVESYLNQIEIAHNEEGTEGQRGPIDPDAWNFYAPIFRDAWEQQFGATN